MNDKTQDNPMDERLNEISKQLDEHLNSAHSHSGSLKRSRLFWGLALIAGGIIWLGDQVGWFELDLPFWPTAMIVLGLYWVISSRKH